MKAPIEVCDIKRVGIERPYFGRFFVLLPFAFTTILLAREWSLRLTHNTSSHHIILHSFTVRESTGYSS